jgi:hypothetical protein
MPCKPTARLATAERGARPSEESTCLGSLWQHASIRLRTGCPVQEKSSRSCFEDALCNPVGFEVNAKKHGVGAVRWCCCLGFSRLSACRSPLGGTCNSYPAHLAESQVT